jgi:hypothetical protein
MAKQTKKSAQLAIRKLVDQSVSRDEVVRADVTQAELDAAVTRGSGSCDLVSQYGYTDVWGGPDHRSWRMHLTVV